MYTSCVVRHCSHFGKATVEVRNFEIFNQVSFSFFFLSNNSTRFHATIFFATFSYFHFLSIFSSLKFKKSSSEVTLPSFMQHTRTKCGVRSADRLWSAERRAVIGFSFSFRADRYLFKGGYYLQNRMSPFDRSCLCVHLLGSINRRIYSTVSTYQQPIWNNRTATITKIVCSI